MAGRFRRPQLSTFRLAVLWVLPAVALVVWVAAREAVHATWLLGLVLTGAGLLMGDAGLHLVRNRVDADHLEEHSTAHTAVFAIVGTFYAVLVAFAIVAVWEDYSRTQEIVQTEANALANLERVSRGFPVEVRRQVQEAASTYARLVVDKEWPAMAEKGTSEQAHAALIELWSVYTDVGPEVRDSHLYDESIGLLTDIDDNRRLRLLASRKTVPAVTWILIYGGGFVTIALTYFFAVTKGWLLRSFVASIAFTVSVSLFLVAALEGPFSGGLVVSSGAFSFVLENMQHLEY